jgi:hypothetical protein
MAHYLAFRMRGRDLLSSAKVISASITTLGVLNSTGVVSASIEHYTNRSPSFFLFLVGGGLIFYIVIYMYIVLDHMPFD